MVDKSGGLTSKDSKGTTGSKQPSGTDSSAWEYKPITVGPNEIAFLEPKVV